MAEADLKLVQRVTGPSGLTATVAYDPTDGQYWVGRKDIALVPIADTKAAALEAARDLVSAGASEGGLFSRGKKKAGRARRAKKPARARAKRKPVRRKAPARRRPAKRRARRSYRGLGDYGAAHSWCSRRYRPGAKRKACISRRMR